MQARLLGRKICQLFQLCSEVLSKQQHYDFGMRALKAVLFLAGEKRRKSTGEESEEHIFVQAIIDSNLPKFL